MHILTMKSLVRHDCFRINGEAWQALGWVWSNDGVGPLLAMRHCTGVVTLCSNVDWYIEAITYDYFNRSATWCLDQRPAKKFWIRLRNDVRMKVIKDYCPELILSTDVQQLLITFKRGINERTTTPQRPLIAAFRGYDSYGKCKAAMKRISDTMIKAMNDF